MAVSPQQDLAFRQKDRDYCVLRGIAVCYEFVVVVLFAICISRFPESHLFHVKQCWVEETCSNVSSWSTWFFIDVSNLVAAICSWNYIRACCTVFCSVAWTCLSPPYCECIVEKCSFDRLRYPILAHPLDRPKHQESLDALNLCPPGPAVHFLVHQPTKIC